MSWEGKRVLITWTDAAWENDCDWPSFIVVADIEDGLLLRGCTSPNGTKHIGDQCFAPYSEIRNIIEWKEP